MSIAVPLDGLRAAIAERGAGAYLLTVSDDGRPHAVHVAVGWDGDELVAEVGKRSAANAAARPSAVSLLFPVRGSDDYSLIVDGSAVSPGAGQDRELRIAPSRAVLHRPAAAPEATSACGSDCVPLLAPPPVDPIATAELLGLLDELLAAERAGVKVAAALRAEPLPDAAHVLLDGVLRDEAESCRLLVESIRSLGAEAGTRTGDFVQKALAIEGAWERLAFLQRGQRWVVRRLRETVPRVESAVVARALREMLALHDANIAACEELLDQPR